MVGDPRRSRILQRLCILLWILSVGLVCFSFVAAGGPESRYAIFVTCHSLLYSGFVLGAVADKLATRSFAYGRLLFTIGLAFLLGVLGPVVMSAAAAMPRT